MSNSTFVQRQITLTIQLGEGSFGDSGFNTVTLTGLRISAAIDKSGMPGFNMAEIRIFGLDLNLMNQLCTLGKPIVRDRNNTITVMAGDATAGLSLAYSGIITEAWADFNGAPEVVFNIKSVFGKLDATKPVPAISYSGPTDTGHILSTIALSLGYGFESNGVSVLLNNPYYPGTAREQAYAIGKDAGIYVYFDDVKKVLSTWPLNGFRGGSIPLISPQTGMIGYPSYAGTDVIVRTLYNPNIVFGGQFQVQSSLNIANATWIANKVVHNLESEMPNGQWFTQIQGYKLGNEPTVPS